MVLESVQFFGAVDRKDRRADGAICSEYPAFYFDVHLNDLKESIASKERMIKAGLVHPTEMPFAQAELAKEKTRLAEINNARVVLKGKDKDEAWALYKELGTQIQDSMPTRTDMMKGLASPHDEVKKSHLEPFINVKGNEKVFAQIGVKTVGGKVTRNQAARMYKILGKALGENTNTERLRKDHSYGTVKSDIPLSELVK